MQSAEHNLATALVAEILAVDQMTRALLTKGLPKGMELSQFMVLNHLARSGGEKTPASLADRFQVTRGAMTNTLNRLDMAGHVHIRPDWDDARRKLVSASPSGIAERDRALAAMSPILSSVVSRIGADKVKAGLTFLRELRELMGES